MRSTVISTLCVGLLGISLFDSASADNVTAYSSLVSWNSAVTDVTTYNILQPPNISEGVVAPPLPYLMFGVAQTLGPATFTTLSGAGYFYDDANYGPNLQYLSDDPGADRAAEIPGVIPGFSLSFDPSTDVTAAAFTLGSLGPATNIFVSVNGSPLAALAVSPNFPISLFSVTDSSPIKNIRFSAPAGTDEVDVIGSYATAKVVLAPEMDPASMASALTLLLGSMVVLRGRRRRPDGAPRRFAHAAFTLRSSSAGQIQAQSSQPSKRSVLRRSKAVEASQH